MQIKKCRICKNKKLKKIFSLGNQPIANNLLNEPKEVEVYPLDLYQCTHCSLIQLGCIIPKETLYDDYLYIPSISKINLQHFENLAESLIKELNLKKRDLVVDIGSSDGSLLNYFKQKGMKVLGIEPAQNIESSIETYRHYFDSQIAWNTKIIHGKAKLIIATNVFAHIDNLDEFLKGLYMLLDEDGTFVAQFPDVRNLFKENQFDTIYHEHLSYFTYEPLYYLFANPHFELYKIDTTEVHGGSMRIYVRRRKPLLEDFISSVTKIKKELYEKIVQFKKEEKKIIGFGAAAKGTVLLNYCNLDYNLIDYVVDGTPYKQGKFIPGVNIPIYPEEHLLKDSPDIVLILAWNFKEEIMEKLNNIPSKKFTYIIPIPKVEIIQT